MINRYDNNALPANLDVGPSAEPALISLRYRCHSPQGGNLMGSVMMPRLLDAELDNLYAQIPRDFFTESGDGDGTPLAKDGLHRGSRSERHL